MKYKDDPNWWIQPEKVLKQDDLEGFAPETTIYIHTRRHDWDDPAFVNALFVVSTKFWPRTVRSDSDADAYSKVGDYAAGAAYVSDDSD
jgi:hypothetical protein